MAFIFLFYYLIAVLFSVFEIIDLALSDVLSNLSLSNLAIFFNVEIAANLILMLPLAIASLVFGRIISSNKSANAAWNNFWSKDIKKSVPTNMRLLFAFVLLLVFAAIIGYLTKHALASYETKSLIPFFIGGMSVVAAMFAIFAYAVIWRFASFLLSGLLSFVPFLKPLFSTRTTLPILYLLVFLAVIFLRIRFEDTLDAYDTRAVIYAMIALPLFIFSIALGRTYYLKNYTLKKTTKRFLISSFVFVFLASHTVTLFTLGQNMSVSSVFFGKTAYSKTIMEKLKTLADFDDDGYSVIYGDNDCDNFNEQINPGQSEIPDNNIDDNCMLGDFKSSMFAVEKPVFYPLKNKENPAKNVLLIFVDAVRADMTSLNGYEKDTTPELKKYAKTDCVNFTQAYTQAPKTIFSVASTLFAKLPSHLKWTQHGKRIPDVADSNESIAETLLDRGYETTSFNMSLYAIKYESSMYQGTNFIDFYQSAPEEFVANRQIASSHFYTDQIIDLLTPHIKDNSKPFFFVTHYMDPHHTYKPHKDSKIFGNSSIGKYLGEVHFSDKHIGRLFDWLKEVGLFEKTHIIFTSDHGEGHGDHKRHHHGHNIYNEQIHVPLMICSPGISPKVVNDPVRLLDIAPTIFNLTGESYPDYFEGRSLLPLLYGKKMPQKEIISELTPHLEVTKKMTSIIDNKWKLIFNHYKHFYELFDLANDPKELNNQFDQQPKTANALLAKLNKSLEYSSALKGGRQANYLVKKVPKDMKPLDIVFEEGIKLLGYTLSKKALKPSETQNVTFYWTSTKPIQKNYKILVHINIKDKTAKKKKRLLKADHMPAHNDYAFTEWKPGQIIKDEFDFVIPEIWPKTKAKLWVGLWHKKTRSDYVFEGKEFPDKKKRINIFGFKIIIDKDKIGTKSINKLAPVKQALKKASKKDSPKTPKKTTKKASTK